MGHENRQLAHFCITKWRLDTNGRRVNSCYGWRIGRLGSQYRHDLIYFRQGVTPDTPYGTRWRQLDGLLKQIDAGSSGVVYGVNRYLFFASI